MSTNSLILKNTVFPEWYQDRIQACTFASFTLHAAVYLCSVSLGVHYVPIKSDLSDLYDVMLFFKGESAIGNNGHDDLAREIAMEGKTWSRTYWRREDLIAYQFRFVVWLLHCLNLLLSSYVFYTSDCSWSTPD